MLLFIHHFKVGVNFVIIHYLILPITNCINSPQKLDYHLHQKSTDNDKSMKTTQHAELTGRGLMYCLQSSLLIVYVIILLLSNCYDIILLYYFIVQSSDYCLCIYLSNI